MLRSCLFVWCGWLLLHAVVADELDKQLHIYRCVDKGEHYVIAGEVADHDAAAEFHRIVTGARQVRFRYMMIDQNPEGWLIVDRHGMRLAAIPIKTVPPTIWLFSVRLGDAKDDRLRNGRWVTVTESLQEKGFGGHLAFDLSQIVRRMRDSSR